MLSMVNAVAPVTKAGIQSLFSNVCGVNLPDVVLIRCLSSAFYVNDFENSAYGAVL